MQVGGNGVQHFRILRVHPRGQSYSATAYLIHCRSVSSCLTTATIDKCFAMHKSNARHVLLDAASHIPQDALAASMLAGFSSSPTFAEEFAIWLEWQSLVKPSPFSSSLLPLLPGVKATASGLADEAT